MIENHKEMDGEALENNRRSIDLEQPFLTASFLHETPGWRDLCD